MKATLMNEAIEEINQAGSIAQLRKVKKKYLDVGGIITKELSRIPRLSRRNGQSHARTVLSMQRSFNSIYEKKEKELTDGSTTG